MSGALQVSTRHEKPEAKRSAKRDRVAKRVAAHRAERGENQDYSFAPEVIQATWSLQETTAQFHSQQRVSP